MHLHGDIMVVSLTDDACPLEKSDIEADFADDETLIDSQSISTYLGSTWDSMSAVERHQFENGRRYHGYRQGNYWLPDDEKEQERLDLFHTICVIRMEGLLHIAPIGDTPQRILDLGTGTGIWAIDMACKYTNAEVIGTDLSAMQPPVGLPNLSFDIDDIESEWVYPLDHFSYIHGRVLAGAIKDWPALFRQAYKHLKPGGYLEFHEMDSHAKCDDGTFPPGCPWDRYHSILNETSAQAGRSYGVAPAIKDWMIAAGFSNVKEVKLKIPLNAWPKDRKLKEVGKWMQLNMLEGIEAFAMAPLTRVLGWSEQDVKTFMHEVSSDLKNRNQHVYHYLYVVYGQKPDTAPLS